MNIVEELRFWEDIANNQSNLSVHIDKVPSSLFRDAAETIERLRQGLWDCARLAGEDLDGDNSPDHLVLPELVVFAHNAIRSLAEDHGYLADDVDRLEAEIDRLRALIEAWCDAHEKANVIDAFGQYDEACEALRKEVGRGC